MSCDCFVIKPTYSMLIFDHALYVFAYPDKRLGNESPSYFSRTGNRAMEFFVSQFERIQDAVPSSIFGDRISHRL
jgi:hypothetical protein